MGKILLTGGTGWLGKASLRVLNKRYPDATVDLVASRNRDFSYLGKKYFVKTFEDLDVDRETYFGIIHLAHLTRDKIQFYGKKKYSEINKKITEQFINVVTHSKTQWVTTVSSGAVAHFSGELDENPYSASKLFEENALLELCKSQNVGFSIGRLWGSLGEDMPVNTNYAVSDFIYQGVTQGQIQVNSKHKVYRRYVDSAEFMAVCVSSAELNFQEIFDSGGELIEILELAELIGSILKVPVTYSNNRDGESDDYFPDSKSYERLLKDTETTKINFLDSLNSTIESHKLQILG